MARPAVSVRTRSRGQICGSDVNTPDMHKVIQELSSSRHKLSNEMASFSADEDDDLVKVKTREAERQTRLQASTRQNEGFTNERNVAVVSGVKSAATGTPLRQPLPEEATSPLTPIYNLIAKSPLTPVYNLVNHMRERLEKQLLGAAVESESSSWKDESKTSPGLTQLRNTPVKCVRDRQRLLEKKHRAAQGRCDGSSVGGGISLWPNMSRMRLTSLEIWSLALGSTALGGVTVLLFMWLHGSVLEDLHHHRQALERFYLTTELSVQGQRDFDSSVLHWHATLSVTMNHIEERFGWSLGGSTVLYQVGVVMYICGTAVLLYYLADNVLAKSNLTPSRIRTWVCLLVVVGVWTVLGTGLLVSAQRLETAIEKAVHSLSEHLLDLVYTDLDLTTYHNVLLYWRTRCLPPTTSGTLSIMGLVQVRDMAYYLQYYSLPLITALVTPVIKLILSLRAVYAASLPVT